MTRYRSKLAVLQAHVPAGVDCGHLKVHMPRTKSAYIVDARGKDYMASHTMWPSAGQVQMQHSRQSLTLTPASVPVQRLWRLSKQRSTGEALTRADAHALKSKVRHITPG